MDELVILGAGTAGTMIANKLRRRLRRGEWSITVVDRDDEHHYQPGYLFVPFGDYMPEQVVRSRHTFLPDGVDFLTGTVDLVDTAANVVVLEDGRRLEYDQLVIATGTATNHVNTSWRGSGSIRGRRSRPGPSSMAWSGALPPDPSPPSRDLSGSAAPRTGRHRSPLAAR